MKILLLQGKLILESSVLVILQISTCSLTRKYAVKHTHVHRNLDTGALLVFFFNKAEMF